MIFIITSKDDLTADYFILKLIERKIPYFRFNTEDMPSSVEVSISFPDGISNLINDNGVALNLNAVSGVWYRRPKKSIINPDLDLELQEYVREDSWFLVHGLCEMIPDSARWVSRPEIIRRAENKIYQLKIAHSCGLSIPDTVIGNSPQRLEMLPLGEELKMGNYIAKPIRNGKYYVRGETKIFFTSIFPQDWQQDELRVWPIIAQKKVQKRRDVRVTVFGSNVFSVAIDTTSLSDEIKLDWRRAIDQVSYDVISLPQEIENRLINLLDKMGLAFGAIDLIETPDGNYVFLEVNPNGQWAWIEERTGLAMRDALIDVLLEKL